jgi:hypothetical protein
MLTAPSALLDISLPPKWWYDPLITSRCVGCNHTAVSINRMAVFVPKILDLAYV